ncbi:MAG: OmpA family protein [Myxococcota bacterium]|nr:OmpA family protein [Myxococcota bacterium]
MNDRLMMLLTMALFWLGGSRTAMAANPDRFRVSGSGYDGSGALQLSHPASGGQWAGYAGGTIVDSEQLTTDPAVLRMAGGQLGAGLALHDLLRVDLALPVYASIVRADATQEDGVAGVVDRGVGDFRVGLTVPILPATSSSVGMGLSPWFDAATGDPEAGTGDGQPGGGAVLSIGSGGGRTTGWRLNAGVISGADGPGGRFGAGFDHPVRPRTRIGVELIGEQTFRDDGLQRVEAHGYARFRGAGATNGTIFVGSGLVPGSGSPALRVGVSLSWMKPGIDADPDGDGIPSDEDACPWTPEDGDGDPDRDGCPEPDADDDGVPDAVDDCPDEAEDPDGYADRDGCADLDNDYDGILDVYDACPLQGGPAATGGCPDEDQDGTPDREDECPSRPGPSSSFGCPDWDGDHVPDARDRCPTHPADPSIDPRRSDGCPSAAWRGHGRILSDDPVYFAFNRAGVDPRSVPMLLEVARIINRSPDILLVEVAGHADRVGSPGYNRRLSRLRAAAVRDVLVRQGGVDPRRVVAVGSGEERPAASNATDSGRAENRRVEFIIRRSAEEPHAPPPGYRP